MRLEPCPHPHNSDQILRIIILSDDEDAPSTSQPAIAKPRGLGATGRHTRAINTVIEDFDYRHEGSTTDPEEEDEEDSLEYPGDAGETLVRVSF